MLQIFADVSHVVWYVRKIRQQLSDYLRTGRRERVSLRAVGSGRESPVRLSGLYRCRSCGWCLTWPPQCCRDSPGTLWRSPSPLICLGWTEPCRRSLPEAAGRHESVCNDKINVSLCIFTFYWHFRRLFFSVLLFKLRQQFIRGRAPKQPDGHDAGSSLRGGVLHSAFKLNMQRVSTWVDGFLHTQIHNTNVYLLSTAT